MSNRTTDHPCVTVDDADRQGAPSERWLRRVTRRHSIPSSDARHEHVIEGEPQRRIGVPLWVPSTTFGAIALALASLVSAVAEPGVARLHWWSPDGANFEAGVERAVGDGGFAEIARVRADGTGHVRYDDRDVTPRATYRYRLAVTENGATSWLGEVTLRVPEGSRLALAGFVPNPAVGKPRLAYTLPTAQRARIEVLDIAGRRVLERDLDSSPGEHVVAFDAKLGPGVYTLRLTQGTHSVTARATIVR